MDIDLLTHVLQAVRLSGAFFFDLNASGSWVAEAPPSAGLVPWLMPDKQHIIEYHVLIEGECWAELRPDGAPIRLSAGSVVAFPRGDPHTLSSAPGMRGEPDWDVIRRIRPEQPNPLKVRMLGAGPAGVRLICGFLGCDALPFNPLLRALPRVIHVAGAYSSDNSALKALIDAANRESREQRIGRSSFLARLSELIFIEVIRRHVESLEPDSLNWLTAASDPQLGRVMDLLHAEVDRDWSLASLSREAGVSRTVLVERFNAYLGMAPMTYLTQWRMQVAAGLLLSGTGNLQRIADAVGYRSEAAFSRAFKRHTGLAPTRWRKGAVTAA